MNFWETQAVRNKNLAYHPNEYTVSLRDYMNNYFIKKFKENKNFEFHYKNILERFRNRNGSIRGGSIFVDDSILLSTKRMNYDDYVVSNVNDPEIISTEDWFNNHSACQLMSDGKLHGYRVIILVSRTTPLSENGERFLVDSPLFNNLTNEFKKVHRYYFDEITYIENYEFLKIKEHIENLKNNNPTYEWDRLLDVLLKTFDDSYIQKLITLKENINQLDEIDYQTLKDEILISDVYKERKDIYDRGFTLLENINFKDIPLDRIKKFIFDLRGEEVSGKKTRKSITSLLNQMITRNRYILTRIAGVVNDYGDM